MFDLSDRPLVWISVDWAVLRPGKKDSDLAVESKAEVDLRVELLDRDEVRELFADQFEPDVSAVEMDGKELSGRELELARFMRLVDSWRKLSDGENKEPELTEENARRLLAAPGFSTRFHMKYLAAIAGKKELREGN